jgi:hypothetical protein
VTDRRQHPVAEAEPPTATDRLRWDDNLTKAGQGRAILRSPLRLLMAAGAITMMIGTFLPWAQGHLGLLPVQFGGFDRASDGLILFVFGIVVLVVFVRSPDFLSAPEGARRWAPLVLGLVCLGVWLVGLQQSELTIESWQRDYGNGSIAAGYWITGIGAVLVAITGAYATLRHHESQTSDPIALFRRPRRTDAGPILTWVGGIAGLLVGIWAALAIFPPISVAAPMVFMGGVAGIVGAYLGRSIGNAIGGQRRSGVIGR